MGGFGGGLGGIGANYMGNMGRPHGMGQVFYKTDRNGLSHKTTQEQFLLEYQSWDVV